MASWSTEDLRLLDESSELRIAVRRRDGSFRSWTPIWVVHADGQVYVRSWHRRETGWFGQAVRSGRARAAVPGLEVDVTVVDVGSGSAELRAAVDAAYRAKYDDAGSMVTPAAAATTLRLDR